MIRRLSALLLATAFPVAAEVPQFTRVALMGDSITGNLGDEGYFYKHGLWSGLSAALNQQVDVVYNGKVPCFATAGARSDQIRDRHLSRVLASNAEACIILAGTNDGGTVEETAATLKQMGDALADHGITPILCDVLPVASGAAATRPPWLLQLRDAIRAICDADPRYVHLDWFNVLDADNNGVIDDDGYYANDGGFVHPDGDGMSRLAAYAAQVLAPHVRPRDLFDGIDWLSDDHYLQPGSGQTPVNWYAYPPNGTTVSQSLTAREDGVPGNWWNVSLTSGDPGQITYLASFPTGGPWQTGDVAELVVEYRTKDDVSAIWNMRPSLTAAPSNLTRYDSETNGTVITNLQRSPAGILRTPFMVLPANTGAFSINLQITGTGSFSIGRVGVRRVKPTFTHWITQIPNLTDLTPDGDPDGDGLTNLAEWTLGGNPAVQDAGSLTAATATGISFIQRPASVQDSTLILQRSTDLNTWADLPLAAGTNGDVTLTPDAAIAGRWTASSTAPSGFFRLHAGWKP